MSNLFFLVGTTIGERLLYPLTAGWALLVAGLAANLKPTRAWLMRLAVAGLLVTWKDVYENLHKAFPSSFEGKWPSQGWNIGYSINSLEGLSTTFWALPDREVEGFFSCGFFQTSFWAHFTIFKFGVFGQATAFLWPRWSTSSTPTSGCLTGNHQQSFLWRTAFSLIHWLRGNLLFDFGYLHGGVPLLIPFGRRLLFSVKVVGCVLDFPQDAEHWSRSVKAEPICGRFGRLAPHQKAVWWCLEATNRHLSKPKWVVCGCINVYCSMEIMIKVRVTSILKKVSEVGTNEDRCQANSRVFLGEVLHAKASELQAKGMLPEALDYYERRWDGSRGGVQWRFFLGLPFLLKENGGKIGNLARLFFGWSNLY